MNNKMTLTEFVTNRTTTKKQRERDYKKCVAYLESRKEVK